MRFRSYRSWAKQLSPASLVFEWGPRLVETIGLTIDMLAEWAVNAGDASMLESPDFAPDALGLIGAQRRLPRYAPETDAGYKARVRAAWESWPQAGTRPGLIAQLAAAGMTAKVKEMYHPNRVGTQDAEEYWDWDGDEDNWSRIWVVIEDHPWPPWLLGEEPIGSGVTLGAAPLGDGATLGSIATEADIEMVRSIVRAWKPGHVVCTFIILVLDMETWLDDPDPAGTWGEPGNRNPNVAYVAG